MLISWSKSNSSVLVLLKYVLHDQESEEKKKDLDSYTKSVSDLSAWIQQARASAQPPPPPLVPADVTEASPAAHDQVQLLQHHPVLDPPVCACLARQTLKWTIVY